jgi:branched-chain amino acid transport system substrate-binding protein
MTTRTWRPRRSVRLTAVMAAAATFIGGTAWAQSGEEFRVGWVLSLSGVGSAYADQAQQAMQLALDEINAKDRAGRKITVITVDDATDPKTSADVCSRLVLQDKVQAIIGQQPTPARVACNQFAQKAGIPYLSASYGAGDLCIPNLFSIGPVPNQLNNPMLDYLVSVGLKKVFLIGSDYSGPRAAAAGSEKFLKENGGQALGPAFVATGSTDFSPEIAKIASSKPDAILEMIVGTDGPTFHKQITNDPRASGIVQADLFLTEAGAKALGKAATGTLVSGGYLSTLDTDENKAFVDGLRKKFGDKAKPDLWGVFAYNALYVLADAVKSAGTDEKAIMAAIGKASFTGPNGPISIENNYTKQTAYIGKVDDAGVIKVIKNMGQVAPQLICKF